MFSVSAWILPELRALRQTINLDPINSRPNSPIESNSEPYSVRSYYVALTGSESNPGTLSAAWLSIQKAMNSATPGSIVNIRAGTYHQRLSLNVSGTPGNYITFQPYGFSVPAGGCGGYTGILCGGDQVILDYAYLEP